MPLLDVFFNEMSPPNNEVSCLHILKPKPVPPYFLVVELSAWVNRSKIVFFYSGLMPIPVSMTSNSKMVKRSLL